MKGSNTLPKENVNCSVIGGFRVEVGWRPDGDVQIATTNANSTYTMETGDSSDSKVTEPFYGWYCTLDRAGLNKLIKDLRRARDQAYGADA